MKLRRVKRDRRAQLPSGRRCPSVASASALDLLRPETACFAQSDGKIRLPGMSVVLAKAGPGLFFAAFAE